MSTPVSPMARVLLVLVLQGLLASSACAAWNDVVNMPVYTSNLESDSNQFDDLVHFSRERRSVDGNEDTVIRDSLEYNDPVCEPPSSYQQFLQASGRLENQHVFEEDQEFLTSAVAWTSNGHRVDQVVMLTGYASTTTKVYKSQHESSSNTSSQSWDLKLNFSTGFASVLYKHPTNDRKLFIINGMTIYMTTDGGDSWETLPPLLPSGGPRHITDLKFDEAYDASILVIDSSHDLYASLDSFKDSTKTIYKSKVYSATWGPYHSIFANTRRLPSGVEDYDVEILESYNHTTKHWDVHLEMITQFALRSKFMLAIKFPETITDSEYLPNQLMLQFTSGTWQPAQFPVSTRGKVLTLMTATEDAIYVLLSNKSDTSYGDLYMAQAPSLLFTLVLKNCLGASDSKLFQVESLEGVFLATVLNPVDQSLRSVVSYNKGAVWQDLPQPSGVQCTHSDISAGHARCSLQIASSFSIKRGVNALPPSSTKHAPGLILAHGIVSESMSTKDHDLYVSTDGGYTFNWALKGPHITGIAANGSIIVAVEMTSSPVSAIKFSVDGGSCWTTYPIPGLEQIRITAVLDLSVSSRQLTLWGFVRDSHMWTVYTLDFDKILQQPCTEAALERVPFPDSSNGCHLGYTQVMVKLRKNSWCMNTGTAQQSLMQASFRKSCVCTKMDYLCDFGFTRSLESVECQMTRPQPALVCVNNSLHSLSSQGYVPLQGDLCHSEEPVQRRRSLSKIHDGCSLKETEKSLCEMLNGGCSRDATCTIISQTEVQCSCIDGFYGSGNWCKASINLCSPENNPCPRDRSFCSYDLPKTDDLFQKEAVCKCRDGFVGDGVICVGTVEDALDQIPSLHYFRNWIELEYVSDHGSDIHDRLLRKGALRRMSDFETKSTFFLPVNLNGQTPDLPGLICDKEIRLEGQLANGDDSSFTVYTISDAPIQLTRQGEKYYANGIEIVQANVLAKNGYIHLTAAPVVVAGTSNTTEGPEVVKSKKENPSKLMYILPPICGGVLLMLVLVVLLGVIKRKTHKQAKDEDTTKQHHTLPAPTTEEKKSSSPLDNIVFT